MKTTEYTGHVVYKVNCACDDDDHITTIQLEYYGETNDIDLTFYKKMSWDAYWGCNWFTGLWKRIKAATKMLFTGWIEVDADAIIRDEEHIQSFIDALEEGRKKIKETSC